MLPGSYFILYNYKIAMTLHLNLDTNIFLIIVRMFGRVCVFESEVVVILVYLVSNMTTQLLIHSDKSKR